MIPDLAKIAVVLVVLAVGCEPTSKKYVNVPGGCREIGVTSQNIVLQDKNPVFCAYGADVYVQLRKGVQAFKDPVGHSFKVLSGKCFPERSDQHLKHSGSASFIGEVAAGEMCVFYTRSLVQ